MTWTLSTIVAEIFYCVIGALFALNGIKALKDSGLKTRVPTAIFWFIVAFTFIAGPCMQREVSNHDLDSEHYRC